MRDPRFVFKHFRTVLNPRKPRNPLLRVLFGVAGLVILAGLLVVGLFVGAAMLLAGLVLKLFAPRRRAARAQAARSPFHGHHEVVDAQYTVVNRQAIQAPR